MRLIEKKYSIAGVKYEKVCGGGGENVICRRVIRHVERGLLTPNLNWSSGKTSEAMKNQGGTDV